MTTFAEIVATVVVHSSTMALSHFGVTMTPAPAYQDPPPAAERVVARTPAPQRKVLKLTTCPKDRHPARAVTV